MQLNRVVILLISFLVLWGCKPKEKQFTIKGEIIGGQGKYIKRIDMLAHGLTPDSLELDLAGRFEFGKVINEPHDYILYFNPKQSIRITPLPEEQIMIKGNAANLLDSYTVSGSASSKTISYMLKSQKLLTNQLDSVREYYMQNQLNPNIDSVIKIASFRSDSIFAAGRGQLISIIETDPGSMASYIALAQKLGVETNYFTIKNDLEYFELVDSALTANFDSAMVVRMLHGYILRSKQLLTTATQKSKGLQIGTKAPEIELPNVYGDTLSLSELKGKYVLVDFWGSWCRPCRTENANLRLTYGKYKKLGFEVFQVALERSKEDWKNTIREDKLYWKYQVSELNYMMSNTSKDYSIKSLPANFLISPEGIVIAKDLYGKQLSDKLNELLGPKPVVVTQ